MADVSLDDLIKQDREKNKVNRSNNKPPQKKFPQNKRFEDNRNQPRQNPNSNQHQQEDNRPFKKKFIKKDYEDTRNHPRDNREKKVEKITKQREERSDEEVNEKQVRTLKVLGLSPEFKNEDLYKLFATEGAMEKCLIEQDNFGRNLNTAIVKYHNPESAASAISNINRHRVMNCVLTVEPYKFTKR